MRFKTYALLSSVLLLSAGTCLAGTVKIGVADLKKLMAEFPAAQALREQIQANSLKGQDGLEPLRKEIEKMVKDYESKKKDLNEKQNKERESAISRKQEEYALAQQKSSAKDRAIMVQAEKVLLEQLKSIISETAQAQGFDMVLDTHQVLYAQGAVDLTEEILKKLRKLK